MMFDRDDGSVEAMRRLRTGYEIAKHGGGSGENDMAGWANAQMSTGAHLLLALLHRAEFSKRLVCR